MKNVLVILLSFVSLLPAMVVCYDLDEYDGSVNEIAEIIKQNAYDENYRDCISKGGAGSTFTMQTPQFVKSCAGFSGSTKGYLKFQFGCDYCTGKKMDDKLKAIEEDCKNGCMESVAYCQKPDLIYEGGWGGEIVNDDECGETLPECLSEGSSSSVGEDEQSSSSEVPVSSEAESSSSEDEEQDSSNSGKIESSSSDDEDDGDEDHSSSSDGGCGNGTGHCPIKEDSLGQNTPYDEIECTYSRTPYWELEGTGECVTKWVPKSNSKRKRVTRNSTIPPTLDPRDINKMTFEFQCVQSKNILSLPNGNYNHLVIRSNVPYAIKEENYMEDYYCYKTLNDCLYKKNEILMSHPKGFWCGPYASDGYSTMTDYGCSIIHPYDGKKITSGMNFYYTNEKGFSISDDFGGTMMSNLTEDFLYNAIRKAAQNAEMTIVLLKNGTSVYSNIEAMDEECAKWQKRGNDERSSSSEMGSSSSWKTSSSSLQEKISSSNVEIESSSSMEIMSSSSSEILYSSWNESSSSSKKNEVSSSSIEKKSSSSTYVESSSSDFVYSSSDDGVFVAGGDQEYTSDQIFKGGLDNMEDGKCYSLNPARGTQHGWINKDAQDSWWWREVDCETGDKVDNNRVGACPGFPLDNVPSNPQNACFAYNGSCYKCNPDRGSECSNSWLWLWNFTPTNVGWWYKEVDCYNPFGDDSDFICPDGSALYKSAANNGDIEEKIEEKQSRLTQYSYFDALGRSVKKENAFRVKRSVYVKSQPNRDVGVIFTSNPMPFKTLMKTVSGHVSASTNAVFSYSAECSYGEMISLIITITLSTPEDEIDVYLEGNDVNLRNHELKHKKIYMDYGNDSWIASTTISRRMTKKNVCEKIKNDYWSSVEEKFRTMLNLQNAWDDEDKNNVSHERINVNQEIERLKKQWLNSKCE